MSNAPQSEAVDISGKYEYDGAMLFRISLMLVLMSVGVVLMIATPLFLFYWAMAEQSVVLLLAWLGATVGLYLIEARLMP